MTQLQELRRQAKEKALKGYSKMGKFDLQLLLAGKRVPKKLRKNQVSVGTQTDFRMCDACALEAQIDIFCLLPPGSYILYSDGRRVKIDTTPQQRRIFYDGDLEIDADTGEVVGCAVDYSRY